MILFSAWGAAFFVWVEPLFRWALWVLEHASTSGLGVLEMGERPIWLIIAACFSMALLVSPIRLPGRYLAGFVLLPMIFFWKSESKQFGEFELTMLDVGQGLAITVKTRNHLLLYDTGPAYRSGFNAGDAIVVPFLKSKGWGEIDRLLISHPASDHVGGYKPVINHMDVKHTPDPDKTCVAGQQWRWDGVDFRVLHPRPGDSWEANDSSCVVRISNGGGVVLLTGDLEKPGELSLLTNHEEKLKATVIQVGHHGSRTSSSTGFVDTVAPQFALIANGYLNRYGFPAPEVVARWRLSGAEVYETAKDGALSVTVLPDRGAGTIRRERIIRDRFWR